MPLYIVATPIGNLEDITLRALRILKEADEVFCEDTRVTRKLLDRHSITRGHLGAFHERSADAHIMHVVSLLEQGKSVAYVTDAGTPGISDPGNRLVAEVAARYKRTGMQEYGEVIPIPGASALSAAISVAGMNMQEFRFMGFLPHKKGRQTKVKEIVASDIPIILYESVHRIQKLLSELKSAGIAEDRQIAVMCELTKKFERIFRGGIDEVIAAVAQSVVKGEYTVIIDTV